MAVEIDGLSFRGRVCIHVGIHKTGTTSIQQTLAANYEKLRDRAILYPTAGRHRGGQELQLHHPLILALIGEKDLPVDTHLDALKDEITAGQPKEIILSSEVLSREYLSAQVFHDLKQVFPHAERRWIVYLRRQDGLAASRYAEHIKVGILSWPDGFRHILRSDYLDHRLRLEKLQAAVGSDMIIPVCFDTQKHRLVESFFDACGVDIPSDLVNTGIMNPALPWATLHCLRVVNALPGAAHRFCRRVILGLSRRITSWMGHGMLNTPKPFTRDQSGELLRSYAVSNRWVEDTYWDGARYLTEEPSSAS